jgi:hypothetical protein
VPRQFAIAPLDAGGQEMPDFVDQRRRRCGQRFGCFEEGVRVQQDLSFGTVLGKSDEALVVIVVASPEPERDRTDCSVLGSRPSQVDVITMEALREDLLDDLASANAGVEVDHQRSWLSLLPRRL